MEKTNIKEMTSKERFERLIFLMKTYQRLMLVDITEGNKFGEKMWKEYYLASVRILKNYHIMHGMEWDSYYYLN